MLPRENKSKNKAKPRLLRAMKRAGSGNFRHLREISESHDHHHRLLLCTYLPPSSPSPPPPVPFPPFFVNGRVILARPPTPVPPLLHYSTPPDSDPPSTTLPCPPASPIPSRAVSLLRFLHYKKKRHEKSKFTNAAAYRATPGSRLALTKKTPARSIDDKRSSNVLPALVVSTSLHPPAA